MFPIIGAIAGKIDARILVVLGDDIALCVLLAS